MTAQGYTQQLGGPQVTNMLPRYGSPYPAANGRLPDLDTGTLREDLPVLNVIIKNDKRSTSSTHNMQCMDVSLLLSGGAIL